MLRATAASRDSRRYPVLLNSCVPHPGSRNEVSAVEKYRPQDADIFRQQRLRYVILDEAHSYSGAQGIDVSLLMRRLREAFPECDQQFILTSATMGRDGREIADFARKLTGGRYSEDDV